MISGQKFRSQSAGIIRNLQHSPHVEVIPITTIAFEHVLGLFEQRPDKNWGLKDCFSFVAMRDSRLTDALTSDDHFREAGFNALLLDQN